MTTLVIASDIFGRTPAFDALADTLCRHAGQTIGVDPYGGERIDFVDETAAYAFFQRQVGLDRYTQRLLQVVSEAEPDRMGLIGFSVGASAIWALSGQLAPTRRKTGIGFYGSQIRQMTQIEPAFPMELLFPEWEPHFEVGRLVAQLQRKTGVVCRTVPYRHGFMNRRSVNFNEPAYHHHVHRLEERIRTFRPSS